MYEPVTCAITFSPFMNFILTFGLDKFCKFFYNHYNKIMFMGHNIAFCI